MMEQNIINKWICEIAIDMIKSMDNDRTNYIKELNSVDEKIQKNNMEYTCDENLRGQHAKILKVLEQMKSPAEFEEQEGNIMLISPEELKSRAYNILADFKYYTKEYKSSMNFAEKSYDAFQNQNAIFVIAKCKEKIKTEKGIFTKATKIEEAEKKRTNEIIDAYLESIRFDPFSDVGKAAAKQLILRYDVDFWSKEVLE